MPDVAENLQMLMYRGPKSDFKLPLCVGNATALYCTINLKPLSEPEVSIGDDENVKIPHTYNMMLSIRIVSVNSPSRSLGLHLTLSLCHLP